LLEFDARNAYPMSDLPGLTVWTIGHSKHEIAEFLEITSSFKIEVIVDVRTSPFSKMAPQFNKEQLGSALAKSGIDYLHMGASLGGRPTQEDFYDSQGHVFYDMMAGTEEFKSGIIRLVNGMERFRIAMMCSEGSPDKCHRTLLVGRVLQQMCHKVLNILPDGTCEEQDDLNAPSVQQSLFGEPEVKSWRSAVSVRQALVQENSLDY
jgi:uncharacterized protein (DUF488 family)